MTWSRRSRVAWTSSGPGHGFAGTRHTRILLEQLPGAQERLGGHAGPVGAFAADQLALDQAHVEPLLGEPAGADLAGRPSADDNDVVLLHPVQR